MTTFGLSVDYSVALLTALRGRSKMLGSGLPSSAGYFDCIVSFDSFDSLRYLARAASGN